MPKGRKIPDYNTYIQAYLKKETQLAKRGFSMTDTMYSKSDYEWMYKNTLAKQKQEVKMGDRKRTGMIIRDMVNDQAYELTGKQAKALQKAGKAMGLKGSLQDYMMKKADLQELIDADAANYYMQGKTSKEVAILIGQKYYGSE